MEPFERRDAAGGPPALTRRTRSGAEITFDGTVVAKLHRPGTDPRALQSRLDLASRLGTVEPPCVLAPLSVQPEPVGSRWRTRWPLVQTVAPVPERVPWSDAGRLLAGLHAQPLGGFRKPHGWPARLRRMVGRLRSHTGRPDTDADPVDIVRWAAAGLPPAVWRTGSAERPGTLVHGDWHLGQLGRRSAESPWVLIDIDDLGVGDPAWDLARPAGFWAAGLMPDADWFAFIASYREAGGVALPAAPADPWPVLDPFARAAVVHAAAAGVTGEPDDSQAALLVACARMAELVQLEKNSRPKPPLR